MNVYCVCMYYYVCMYAYAWCEHDLFTQVFCCNLDGLSFLAKNFFEIKRKIWGKFNEISKRNIWVKKIETLAQGKL